jgi:beta-aspartyl-peptidase (threonine type)
MRQLQSCFNSHFTERTHQFIQQLNSAQMKTNAFSRQSFLKMHFAMLFWMMLLFCPISVLFAQVEAVSVMSAEANSGKWVLVIHGGAGGLVKGNISPDEEKEYLNKLDEALKLGTGILANAGSSVDAVEAVIRFMEDCPLFNAGIGAVLDEEGKAELDASIMDGKTGLAGAVAGVTIIKNPITAARRVMEKSSNVMLIGQGAEKFARTQGLSLVDPSYFITPKQLKSWEKWKAATPSGTGKPPTKTEKTISDKEKQGTVGAVALDQNGNLAAGTSTGGMMGKKLGRVGDSPIIGAGTYANNQTCAVSATGHGEYFIRNVVAFDLSAMMEYRGMSVEEAGNTIIMKKLMNQKGKGGLIAVDKDGNICMPFNTNAMFRGYVKSSGEREVAIY